MFLFGAADSVFSEVKLEIEFVVDNLLTDMALEEQILLVVLYVSYPSVLVERFEMTFVTLVQHARHLMHNVFVVHDRMTIVGSVIAVLARVVLLASMSEIVLFQRVRVVTLVIAGPAFEGFFPGVSQEMSIQPFFGFTRVRALRAKKGLFSPMDRFVVNSQHSLFRKLFRTLFAFVLRVGLFHVTVQLTLDREHLRTFRAFISGGYLSIIIRDEFVERLFVAQRQMTIHVPFFGEFSGAKEAFKLGGGGGGGVIVFRAVGGPFSDDFRAVFGEVGIDAELRVVQLVRRRRLLVVVFGRRRRSFSQRRRAIVPSLRVVASGVRVTIRFRCFPHHVLWFVVRV